MRYLPAVLLVLGLLGVAAVTAQPLPPDPVSELPPRKVPWKGLDEHLSWCLAWMAVAIPPEQWCDVRFVSWNADPKKEEHKKAFGFWCNQMSFKLKTAVPKDVPGTKGEVQYLYLSDYGWNEFAWQTVTQRDPYCREEQGIGSGSPHFVENFKGLHSSVKEMFTTKNPPTVAETLRLMIGYEVTKEFTDKNQFPIIAMTWGPWLFRETMESNRSTSYYDLLFAKNRFTPESAGKTKVTKTRKVEKTVGASGGRDPDGKYYPPGYKFTVEEAYEEEIDAKRKFKFVDFPKNVQEWDQAFGLDVIQKFEKDQYIDLSTGAVVEGGQDQPKVGSIVTLHNRLVRFQNGPLGVTARTFDVFDPVGLRDFIEQAPKLAVGKVTFDAGELIYNLPNGGIGTFLINAKGDRTELAAQAAASGQNVEVKLNPGVRNPGDCFICHGGSGGFNPPRNVMVEMFKKGIDLKIKDKELADRVEEFYLGWEKRVDQYQQPFQDLSKRLTGWDGATLAANIKNFRDWYDEPVDMVQAAAEFGLERGAFEAIAVKSTKGQIGKMIIGMPATRRSWEQDTYRDLGLLLAAQQK